MDTSEAELSYIENMPGCELPDSENLEIGDDPETSRRRDDDPQLRDWFRKLLRAHVRPESSKKDSKSTM
jgi:hypothetical protein